MIVVFAMAQPVQDCFSSVSTVALGEGCNQEPCQASARHTRSTRSGTLPLSPHSVVCNHAAGFASSLADELDSDDESGAAQSLRFAAKLESFGFSDFDADHLLML